MRAIEQGDWVLIKYAHGTSRRATVMHIPQDIGDMRHMYDDDGVTFALNPQYAFLDTIELLMKSSEGTRDDLG